MIIVCVSVLSMSATYAGRSNSFIKPKPSISPCKLPRNSDEFNYAALYNN
jgi:hypothetical protein